MRSAPGLWGISMSRSKTVGAKINKSCQGKASTKGEATHAQSWHGLEELERRLLLSGSLPSDPTALNLSQLDPRDPLFSLASLYDQYSLFQQNATSVPPGEAPAVFASSDPLMQVTGGHVAIEAIGFDTTDALKNELLRLGLQGAAQVNYVVAGQLPIASIVELPLLDALRFVRAETPAITRAGLVDGQGDGPLESNDARSLLTVDGSGLTIGVISDSYKTSSSATVNEATDILNGELPNNVKVILDGGASQTDEGPDHPRHRAGCRHRLSSWNRR